MPVDKTTERSHPATQLWRRADRMRSSMSRWEVLELDSFDGRTRLVDGESAAVVGEPENVTTKNAWFALLPCCAVERAYTICRKTTRR